LSQIEDIQSEAPKSGFLSVIGAQATLDTVRKAITPKMNKLNGFSRSGAVLVLMLGIGGCTTTPPRQGYATLTAPATFNSKLAFSVWSETGPGLLEGWKQLGNTPAAEPIRIPACYAWGIQPEEKTTFQQAVVEAVAAQAPGVASTFWAPAADQDLLVLTRQLPGLRALIIWESPEVTDAGLTELKNFKNLQHLALQHCNGITDAGLARLQDIRELQGLELGYCDKISPAGLAYLKNVKTLQVLVLNGDKINDAALAQLKGLDSLWSLNLSWCDQITDAGLAQLSQLKALRSLNLAKTQITDVGLSHLKELTALQSLNLRACPHVTDAAVADLRKALPAAKIDY
jgi:hypothetical protein